MKAKSGAVKKTVKRRWKRYCKQKAIKAYSPCWASAGLWAILIVVVFGCIFGFPFFLRWVAFELAKCNCLLQPLAQTDGDKVTGLTLLPDFLGGMAGILVGFLLDFVIIEKLKIIRQYKSMLKPLDAELDKFKSLKSCLPDIERAISNYDRLMTNIPDRVVEHFSSEDSKWYTTLSKKVEFEIPEKWDETKFSELLKKISLSCRAGLSLPHIERRIVDDIIADYENSAAIYHLPFSTKKFNVADTLYDINCNIMIISDIDADRFEKSSYEAVLFLINDLIPEFFAMTKVWKRNNSIAQGWRPKI